MIEDDDKPVESGKDVDISLTLTAKDGSRTRVSLDFVEQSTMPCLKCVFMSQKEGKCIFPNRTITPILCGPGKGYWVKGKVENLGKEGGAE